MRTANYTELRKNLKDYLDYAIDEGGMVIVNRGSRGAILLSLDEYNSIMETMHIMSSPGTMKAIKRGKKDIEEGRCIRLNSIEEINKYTDSL